VTAIAEPGAESRDIEKLLERLPAGTRDTVRAGLSSLEAEGARTFDRGPRSTIEPEKKKGHRTLEDAITLLRELGAESALARRGTLGEGGMGVVHLAEQRALGREVAVKSVKADARTADTTLKLLREAWITGALEHPNVIPVHDVRLDADGQPQIVLKKVEGKPWSELFADARAISERFAASDPMEWNLRVFLQVASAIHYAHRRGIVHRDIKPENVMVGTFGEVYVVDWGLALALRDDGTGRLPLAEDARELAGTPCYMAPEMLGGESVVIDERTDVYLLGATLYEIATGTPPRDGPNLLAVISQVLEPLPMPERVPAELSRIILRATALCPADRHASAEELRLAVASFLSHRGSIQLAEEAVERLTELRALSAQPMDDAARGRFDALFTECRFGFQQALRAWPDNTLAREGLTRALEHRIEHELSGGNVAFAAHLLTELPAPAPDLSRRVEAARMRDAEERARQEAFQRDHDPAVGRRTRVFLGLIMTTIWVVAPLLMWAAPPNVAGISGYPGAIAGTLALMGVGLALAIWARDSLSKTWLNRQLVMTVRITLIAQLALLTGSYLAGIAFDHAHTILVLTWGIGVALTANATEQRLYASAIGYLVGFLVLTQRPEWRFPVSAITNLGLMVNVLWIWARVDDDVVEPVKRRVREHRERMGSQSPS
jgi:eukaryotic-like serine/threonine-protein kinase